MKKILAKVISAALIAAIAISGTIAYFTDSDSATNVFTVGNVVIKLIEQQRDLDDKGNPVANSALEDFDDDKNLMPLVGTTDAKDNWGLPTASNFVDKIVTVENTGKSEAYVRVYVGVPKELDDRGALHFVRGGDYNAATSNSYTFTEATDKITTDADYNYYCFTLDGALPSEKTTGAVIVGFYLDSAVDYDDGDGVPANAAYYKGDKSDPANKLEYNLDNKVNIPVYVQAVQTAGFDDAATALDEAFDELPWETDTDDEEPAETPTVSPGPTVDPTDFATTLQKNNAGEYEISTAAELFGFAKMVNDGNTTFANKEDVKVKLTADIALSDEQQWTPIGTSKKENGDIVPINCFKGTFDGGGYTIYHLNLEFTSDVVGNDTYNAYRAGQGMFGYCAGTIQNLKLDYANIEGYGYVGAIAGWLDGNGKIENCTVSNSKIGGVLTDDDGYNATAGAIVGNAEENTELKDCKVSKCNVYGEGENFVGKIAGTAYNGKVTDCTATNSYAYYRPYGETTDWENEKDFGSLQDSAPM